MKPVGLTDPRTGRWPYAAVQLRQENLRADSYNLVGFQNHLKFGEQESVFRLIPGLQDAKFVRFGQIHRNTYINAPTCLTPTLQLKRRPQNFLRRPDLRRRRLRRVHRHRADGRPSNAATFAESIAPQPLPAKNGSRLLVPLHLSAADPANYQPANITFDLLPPADEAFRRRYRSKSDRHRRQVEDALALFDEFIRREDVAAADRTSPPPAATDDGPELNSEN